MHSINRLLFKFAFLAFALTVFHPLPGKEQKPNALWITSEDNSIEWVGCYGAKNAKTPHIDQLAKEGFRYLYCFDNGAVCAPTRSSWITGMHAISNGTQPMRSGFEIPPSSASTTNSCKRPVTSRATARRPTTTAWPQPQGFLELFRGRLRRYWKSARMDNRSSPFSTSDTVMNPALSDP